MSPTQPQPSFSLAPNAPAPMAWPEYEARVKSEWGALLTGAGRDDESQFQRFLERHPSLVPGGLSFPDPSGHLPYFSSVFTQPILKGLEDYRPDFMWIANDSGTLYPVLIEIETPGKRWFNANGDPRAELTHAVNQIAEWRAWFRGDNLSWFRDFYQIPDFEWRNLLLRPQFVLVHGSRAEFQAAPDLLKRRSIFMNSLPQDVFAMTFDRLAPNADLDDTFCIRASSSGFDAVAVSPTLKLSPTVARDLSHIRQKDAAVDASDWLTQDRRDFLKARFPYWEAWQAGRHGIEFIPALSFE